MKQKIENFKKLFWINKQRLTKEGLVPIYLRITINGKRVEITTKLAIDEKH